MMTFPYQLIDLTHTLDPSTPTWDGGCGFEAFIHVDYKDCEYDTKFRIMKMRMNAGIGTHIDAPSHCFSNGKCIHELALEDVCLPCVVIDISPKAHERYSLSLEDIKQFEETYRPIQKGACVMVRTGWDRFWSEPEKYRNNHLFPSVSGDAAEILIKRGVKALGIDTLSSDRLEDGFIVHQAFLGAGLVLLENVAHLSKMPAVGGFIMALPLKIKDATEAPLRLVGLVNK